MERDKLIEKIKQIEKNRYDSLEHADRHSLDGDFYRTVVNKINRQHDEKLCELLTSLTAPVPDGKEELFKDEIDSAIDKYSFQVPYDGTNKFYDEEAAKHYEAGIYWALNRLTPKTPDEG